MIRVEQYSIIAGCQTNVWTQFANGLKKMLIVIPVNEIGFGTWHGHLPRNGLGDS